MGESARVNLAFFGDEKPARAGLRFVGLPVMLFGFSSFVVFTFSVWIDASGLKFWDLRKIVFSMNVRL